MRSRILGTVLTTLVLIASAHATAIFQFTGPGGVHPVTGTNGTGMTISGVTSSGFTVMFSSTMDTLMGASSVPIVSTASGSIHNVTISVPGFSFLTMVIHPVALVAGTITLSAKMSDGTTVDCPLPTCPFGTTNNGSPDIRISGTNGERILSVTITSTSPAGTFARLNQVWFSNAANEFEPVPTPEPSALEGLLLGSGMLGLAEMTRRKLRLGT